MTQDADSATGYAGQQGLTDPNSLFNTLSFLVWQCLGRVSTMKLVKVMAVEAGALGPVGFVDVQPLVNQVDGLGNSVPHGTIYKLPYSRIQGGKNAVILDPEKDDIGWAVFADRDSSVIKNTKEVGNPGSKRRFDLSDGVYFGGILNGTPEQYIQFKDTGILMADKNSNTLEMLSGSIKATTTLFEIDGALKVTGASHFVGDIIADGALAVGGALSAASATISGIIGGASITVTGVVTAASAAFSGVISVLNMFVTGHADYIHHTHTGSGFSGPTNPPS